MPHFNEISRREFFSKGWTLAKAGLLVPPSISLFSAGCNLFDTGKAEAGTGYTLKPTPEVLSSGLEALIIDNYNGRIDQYHRAQAAIAVNSNNDPFIAYPRFLSRDFQLSTLGYATRLDAGKWISDVLASEGTAEGDYVAVIIDDEDRAHVCFSALRTYDGECLYYAKNRNVKKSYLWKPRRIDEKKSVGLENDIAVDSNGKIHISHWSWAASSLKYSTNASGKWRSEVLEPADWRPTSIAVDGQDYVHISFVDSSGLLSYLTNESGIWEKATIPSGVNSVLRIDSTGLINIISNDSNFIYHSVKQGGVWNTSQLPFDYSPEYINPGSKTSMAISNDDSIMLAYVVSDQGNPLTGKLYFATNKGGSWQHSLLDDDLNYANPSIAVDKDGNVHISVISFKEQYKHKLKYVTFTPQ